MPDRWAHSVGHIKSRHMLYHQMSDFLSYIARTLGKATLGIGELLASPLQHALWRWYRMSELTADRAGLLACQDIGAASRAMMKMAGMPLKYHNEMAFESFLLQAKEFEKLDYDKLNRAIKFLAETSEDHPWTVMRAAELLRWVEGGDYEKVLRRDTMERIGERREGDLVYCRACGYRLEGTEGFCSWCGANLKGGIVSSSAVGE